MGGFLSTNADDSEAFLKKTAPILQQCLTDVEDSISRKKWSVFMHMASIIVIGIMLAVVGGFSAKSAADMNSLSNFKNLKDSKDPAYSKTLDEAHGYMAGSSATAWVGFAGLVVTIIIIGFLLVSVILPWMGKNAVQNVASDSDKISNRIATDGTCANVADEIVDSAASTGVMIVKLIDLGVTAFALFMTSLAVRSFLSLHKFKSASASTMSATDKTKLDSAYKNTMITMGLGVSAGLIGILGLVI